MQILTRFFTHKGGTVPMDTETRDMWLKYLPPNRVLKGSMKDNFWEMGDTGFCYSVYLLYLVYKYTY